MHMRRWIVKALALVCVGVVAGHLMSCQPATDETGAVKLSLLEWNGFEKPKYYPEFIARYGGPPAFMFFADTNDALQRMRNGLQVDLAHLCTGQMHEARQAGLIRPIDTSRIPRWGEITPELLDLPDVRIDGKYWLVPWEWGYSTVGYNPEIIEVENPTYDIFIDPRFKGKTALPDDIEVNLYIAGIIGGWEDPLDPTEACVTSAQRLVGLRYGKWLIAGRLDCLQRFSEGGLRWFGCGQGPNQTHFADTYTCLDFKKGCLYFVSTTSLLSSDLSYYLQKS